MSGGVRATLLGAALTVAAGLAACGGTTDGAADATGDSDGRAAACVDDPNALDRPPTGALPCELLPPGGLP